MATSRTLSASFPSPESPQCGEEDRRGVEKPTGWYSERVPNPSQKRYVAAAALMPFSSGRALPSKWDDAERWISSPVSVANVSTSGNNSNCYNEGGVKGNSLSAHFQKRAKSKSGPLGPAGVGVYGSYNNTISPVLGVGVINGAKWRNSSAIESPALAQGHFEGRLSATGGGLFEGGRRSLPGRGDPEWLDLWSGPSSPSNRAGKVSDGTESIIYPDNNHEGGFYDDDDGRGVDRAISSRRDMATQMYPESDQSSSCPSVMSSPISTISTNSPCDKLNMNVQLSQVLVEVKDVQVDDNQTCRKAKRSSLRATHVQQNSSNSTRTDGDNNITKLQREREEARINAWEKLQKAKAESSIQKLEMKLEKKRAASMEKIIEKLRRSEIRAQMMRISLSDGTSNNNNVLSCAITKSFSKMPSFYRRFRLSRSSSSNCTTCYPF